MVRVVLVRLPFNPANPTSTWRDWFFFSLWVIFCCFVCSWWLFFDGSPFKPFRIWPRIISLFCNSHWALSLGTIKSDNLILRRLSFRTLCWAHQLQLPREGLFLGALFNVPPIARFYFSAWQKWLQLPWRIHFAFSFLLWSWSLHM